MYVSAISATKSRTGLMAKRVATQMSASAKKTATADKLRKIILPTTSFTLAASVAAPKIMASGSGSSYCDGVPYSIELPDVMSC